MTQRNQKGQFVKQYTEAELKSRADAYHKQWQQSNIGRTSGQNAQKRARERRRAWLHDYKKGMSCVYCGETNPLCIDLDHINRTEKHAELSKMITGGYKWDDVLAEVAKCQPVCANCHRIKSIIESNKMSEFDLEQYIPESMKHLRADAVAE